jgi:hypothetical protein
MNRGTILDHLAKVERHVVDGERHLANQRALLAELDRDGHDTATALELLHQLEDSQAMHIADRARLRAELDRLKPAQ